jgi:hypothetical protein
MRPTALPLGALWIAMCVSRSFQAWKTGTVIESVSEDCPLGDQTQNGCLFIPSMIYQNHVDMPVPSVLTCPQPWQYQRERTAAVVTVARSLIACTRRGQPMGMARMLLQ